jgi:hypothetical protein
MVGAGGVDVNVFVLYFTLLIFLVILNLRSSQVCIILKIIIIKVKAPSPPGSARGGWGLLCWGYSLIGKTRILRIVF